MNWSDLFNSTVAQGIAWLVSFGIAAGVSYALGWFPNLDDKAKKALQGVVIATLAAFVTAVANLIPQTWLDLRIFDALVALISLLVNAGGSMFGGYKANQHLVDNLFRVDQIKAWKTTLVIAILALSAVAGLLTPTLMYAETYDQMVARMFTAKQTAHPEIWNNCTGNCLTDIQGGNNWWLKPLLAKINAKFPTYATSATLDDLTRYAIVRSNEIAIRADSDCREGLIRDEASRGKWPTAAQFDKCKITQDWWVTQYASNCEQIRADFDVAPPIFKINEWPPYWRASREFGGAY